MTSTVGVERPGSRDATKGPNVVDVGAWFASAKTLRRELATYVPKHRAAGPAL